MPTLPAHPNLDQLRHQAKDLLRAAKTGDADALNELRRVSERVTLDAAQLAVARRFGFASWAKLKTGVDARNVELAEQAIAFCQASVNRIGVAARMLAAAPELAGYSFATAVAVGDATRVAEGLRRDPSLATRTDPRWGWAPLHLACASRWCQLDSARAAGLLAVAELLLDAGVDPTAPTSGRRADWTPLRCVVASANSGPSNRPLAELLLERGAIPNDHDLYLAGFAHDCHELLPLLLAHVPNPAGTIEQALAAPISKDDAESVRLLLEAGADPKRYRDDDGKPVPIIWAAVRADCGTELLELLFARNAEPNRTGPDGRTPYQFATAGGQTELADLLRRHGAADSATSADRFLSACRRADRAEAEQLLNEDPGVLERLSHEERAAIFRAAEHGEIAAVGLMLDLGFPLEIRGDDGGTALHAAAYNGSTQTVRLLLDRGADIEARDTSWNDTPLGWAAVGSGERPRSNDAADWIETVRTLLEHGASTAEISLDPDNPKPPSPEVAELLRAHLDRLPPR
jgi:ankyrin repeat protein